MFALNNMFAVAYRLADSSLLLEVASEGRIFVEGDNTRCLDSWHAGTPDTQQCRAQPCLACNSGIMCTKERSTSLTGIFKVMHARILHQLSF